MKSLLVCFTIASDRQPRNTAFMSALIETRALTRMDERRQVPLLQPTDFSLKRADRVSITGTSGSGKSVFLRALALLDAPSSGQVLWNGQPISNAQIPHYRSHISYLSQRPALIDGTVEDNLRFPFSLKTLRQRHFEPAAVIVDGSFIGPGYARPSTAGQEAAQLFATLEGMLLDPVYTGKAAAAVLEYSRAGRFGNGNVLFIHTGGNAGLYY